MAVDIKIIGQELRRIFTSLRNPMGWNLIDAFTRLEEREERRVDEAGPANDDEQAQKSKKRP